MTPLKIFIGFDKNEIAAYHVLSHSLLSRSSIPLSITPLNRDNLRGIYIRERGPLESTDFSMSRFLVPYLSDYVGWSIFMDCDMLCLSDIAGLIPLIDEHKTVSCCQHDYVPRGTTKFLGAIQTLYAKKNWSSLMVFNNEKCQALTPEAVNTQSGMWLHQMHWADSIGSVPLEWNYLVDENGQPDVNPKILHFTLGTPCLPGYENCTFADLWHKEFKSMISPTPLTT
jgi:hypothetical protein